MGRRLIRIIPVIVLLVSIVYVAIVGAHMQDTEKAKESEDEITMVSLEVSPEISVACLTYDVKTDKEKEELDGTAGYDPVAMFGLYAVRDITPIEGGYRIVCQGIYDGTVGELEKKREFWYYSPDGRKKMIDDAHVHSSQMEITIVAARYFEAVDEGGLMMPIDISPLGVCILPEREWQENARRAYVIADLKDGTSRLITTLPTVNPLGKKYKADPPLEVQKIEKEESQIEDSFIVWGVAAETENCGLRLASENKIDIDQIKNVRLVVQNL